MAAKVDQTADFLVGEKLWENVEFPPPFGRHSTKEEEYVASLDAKTGASLKLTVLNPKVLVDILLICEGKSMDDGSRRGC